MDIQNPRMLKKNMIAAIGRLQIDLLKEQEHNQELTAVQMFNENVIHEQREELTKCHLRIAWLIDRLIEKDGE